MVDGSTLTYSGLEPTIFSGADVTIDGTAGDDSLTLAPDPSDSSNLQVTGATIETATITSVTHELTIDAGSGADSITVSGHVNLGGASVKLLAETITVAAGAEISTAKAGGDSGSVELTGDKLELKDDAKIDTSSTDGNAGKIALTAKDAGSLPQQR